jgi:chromosome segregation ATPase
MKTAFAVALLSLGSGCFLFPAHAERATTPPDGLLVDTSPVQREHVAEARVEVGRCKDALAASQRQHEQDREAVTSAGTRRTAAHAEVEQAEASLSRLESSGSTAEVEVARRVLRTAEAEHGVADARCNLRDRELVRAVQRDAVAKARLDVAVARLDLAKVVAVNTLARPDLQKPDASVFAAEVRQAEAREEVALAGLVAAEREVSVCRDLLTERQAGQ